MTSRSGKKGHGSTWLFLGIVLRLCSLHGIQHGVLSLAVLVRSVSSIQRCICSILVTVTCKAICMGMSVLCCSQPEFLPYAWESRIALPRRCV